ncbi:MAG TPA: PQQ-dependent sugar dehydrogenase [Gemmatimonadales bacterium]|nr:PQQ-dependent sugar dehydrogenase [Gemmatimonadales bacterium]
MNRTLTLVLSALLAACNSATHDVQAQGPAQRSPTPAPVNGVVSTEVIASELEHPWGFALLPDGRFLVTERPGRLRIVGADGTVSAPLTGVPEVLARGQGGLLDVTLDPEFAENHVLYLSFSDPGSNGTAGTAVARARLAGAGLEDVTVIYRQEPKVRSNGHYGSRVVVRADGTLFITQGDRMNQRPLVQDLSTGIGKVMRINADGAAPGDNPFVDRAGAKPEIWSYGHRNVQAAALDPATGELWTVEHGARGGDELNHPEAGKNYGWPVITYGIDYSGVRIGEGTAKEGMEQPVYYWDPVIAPSGMTFYEGDAFPEWKGSILIGSLGTGSLVRLAMAEGKVTSEERYEILGGDRVRDVQVGPDGLVYLVTDEDDGALVRVRPAE